MSDESLLRKIAHESSLQGIQYIFSENYRWTTRVFWIIAIVCSATAFGYYLRNGYRKFLIEPEISTNVRQVFAKEVPFPAITVCTPLFAKNGLANIRDPYRFNGLNGTALMDEKNYMAASIEACAPYTLYYEKFMVENRTERNIVKVLADTFLTVEEAMPGCYATLTSKRRDCVGFFNRVITDRGFCYSFNMLGFNEIFDSGAISEDFHSYRRSKIRKSFDPNSTLYNQYFDDNRPDKDRWTLDDGYSPGHSDNSVPMRGKTEAVFGFSICLNDSDELNLCPAFRREYTYYLHLPNEIITPLFVGVVSAVNFSRTRSSTITSKWQKTSDDLRIIEPKIRGCYFEDERKLQFFRGYVKSHCDFECMTNYTLRQCGCVRFSMPRNASMAVCDNTTEVDCYTNIMRKWPIFDENEESLDEPCGCMKNCNDIDYRIKSVSEDGWNKYDWHDEGSSLTFEIEDRTIEVYESIITYKLQNFISDVGGLFGLFLGCSVLSIVEVIYFLLLYIFKCFSKSQQRVDADKNPFRSNGTEDRFEDLRNSLTCHQLLLNKHTRQLDDQQRVFMKLNQDLLKLRKEFQELKIREINSTVDCRENELLQILRIFDEN